MIEHKNWNKRKSERGAPQIPVDYLWAIADSLHKINPTKQIIYNKIKELWVMACDSGYQRHISDAKYFRDKRDAHIKMAFNSIKDAVDDEIHSKQQ